MKTKIIPALVAATLLGACASQPAVTRSAAVPAVEPELLPCAAVPAALSQIEQELAAARTAQRIPLAGMMVDVGPLYSKRIRIQRRGRHCGF